MPEPGELYDVTVNPWMSNVTVTCSACGAEHLVTWHDDSPPDETALSLWGWIRGHLDSHIEDD